MKIGNKTIKYLYVATTTDKYELPIAVADSTRELANMLGMKRETISMYMCESLAGRNNGFYKIDVSREDD